MDANKILRIVVVSDTHSSYPDVPPGDIFIHCGDFSNRGTLSEVDTFCGYIKSLPFKHKIVIAGNHDVCLDQKSYPELRKKFTIDDADADKARTKLKAVCIYLEHEYTEVEGIRIFGSPYTPAFSNWAFMYRADQAKQIWGIENSPLDILITHGPPYGILDEVSGKPQGCPELLSLIKRLKPKYHLFGHIHENYGTVKS
jgi:predicted phosphodiesterase